MEQKPKKNRIFKYVVLGLSVAAISYGARYAPEPEIAMAMIAGGFALLADLIGSF